MLKATCSHGLRLTTLTRTTECGAGSIPVEGVIFDRCMGSMPTQHREESG